VDFEELVQTRRQAEQEFARAKVRARQARDTDDWREADYALARARTAVKLARKAEDEYTAARLTKHATHNQDDHGNWARLDYRAANRGRRKQGFTFHPVTRSQPRTGKVVAIPDHEEALEVDGDLRANVADWMRRNVDALSREGAHVGGWFRKRTGHLVLDVAIVVHTSEEAEKLMDEFDQEAYWDLDEDREVLRKGAPVPKFLLPADASLDEFMEAIEKVVALTR
jgi:hypothetical protein